jgi:hypothetical protein
MIESYKQEKAPVYVKAVEQKVIIEMAIELRLKFQYKRIAFDSM